MASENDNPPRPFDVETVRQLCKLMSRHELSEIDLAWGDERIRLRRGPRKVAAVPLPPMALAATPAAAPTPPPVPKAAEPEKPAAKNLIEIKSILVGTFYSQREPGTPPFVKVGDRVTTSTVVGLVEAMKVYNDITADCSGVIAEVCVKDKDFVEYNTVLFRVDPTG